jgi:hypothetical protein
MNRWRVGEDRGSKEMDGCPLTNRQFLLKMKNYHCLLGPVLMKLIVTML